MKKLFIVANWKSNKTIDETEKWLHEFEENLKTESGEASNKKIIICPSFTALEHASYCSRNLKLSISLGVQDISPFDQGAYTGEVFGGQLKEYVEYVIVGHSERRRYFKESDEIIFKKNEMVRRFELTSIYCIQDENTLIPDGISIVAYEPPSAIGTGRPDTPENANEIAKKIKEKNKAQLVLYGGSVKPSNVKSFSDMPNIDGFLIGGASLNAGEFCEIIKNA